MVPTSIGNYKLNWFYTFPAANELSWHFNVYQGPFGSSSNCYFLKSNAVVSNNQLSLYINRNSNPMNRAFAGAGIGSWSQHSQIYGRWEVQG